MLTKNQEQKDCHQHAHVQKCSHIKHFRSGPRATTREVEKAKFTREEIGEMDVDHIAKCEIDIRADTSCIGSNFRTLEYTGQACDVFPFHEWYESIKNVPVVQTATAYDDDRGFTHLLVINEALSLGRGMNHSLINPNQIQMFGHTVSDDPFDHTRPS
eukprot:980939-Ditylum_brightwellii.AAC.1